MSLFFFFGATIFKKYIYSSLDTNMHKLGRASKQCTLYYTQIDKFEKICIKFSGISAKR